jgi:fumarylacetoacetase
MTQLLTSFLEIDPHSDFTIHNLPYGIFSEVPNGHKRVGVAIGEWVLDLALLESEGLLNIDGNINCFNQPTLNKFIESGKHNWKTCAKCCKVYFQLIIQYFAIMMI